MPKKITDLQMKNLVANILFKTKSDAQRTYNNIVFFLKDKKTVLEGDLKDALRFLLSSYVRNKNDKEIIFWINSDSSVTEYDAANLDKGIDLVHKGLMNNDWYKALLRKGA